MRSGLPGPKNPKSSATKTTTSLSFHSLVFRISLVNFKQGISLVIFCLFQGFCGFGSERKSLVNLRFFLGKTEKARNGRTGLALLDKHRQTQISGSLKKGPKPRNAVNREQAQPRANADKREQTQNERIAPPFAHPLKPRGPKDQKNSRFRARLKISSENEIFERAVHRGPIFCGEIESSRLKISIEIKNFDRDQKF